jgi:hypothetical protein
MIVRGTYPVLAQPSARGAVGVVEVRHLWHAGTTHHSGEPREDVVAPRVGGGSTAPWAPLSTVARKGGPLKGP